MTSYTRDGEDVPDIVPGEVVHSHNGDLAYTVIKQIGTGRCCVVYSGSAVRDGSMVALKFFRRGSNYEGAVQRERYILDTFQDPKHNVVSCYAYLTYRGMHCLVLELLDVNIRQIIFQNNRQGLSPWATFKFAKDVFTSLRALHKANLVHADLKPANILWSGHEGVFKCIDFGLSFSTEEEDIHQIQSSGYRSPEAATWNTHKEAQKVKRKRKLEGTFLQLNYICPPLFSREPETDDSKSPAIIINDKENDIHDKLLKVQSTDLSDGQATEDVSFTESHDPDPENKELHHSDSHSSGIFSQSISERSCCSSHLSWEVESECKTKAKRIDNSKKLSDICQKDATKDSSNIDIDIYGRSKKGEATSSLKTLNVDEEELDTFDENDIQDWRKTRGKSVVLDRSPLLPMQPSTSSDIWSVGCLLTEAVTGRKLFQTGDKLASVLRPSQLLEMKLGETEVAWSDRGEEQMFIQLKDLILNCISEDPSSRVTADEALNHPIFKLNPDPSVNEIYILQSPILQFTRYIDEENEDENCISEEMLDHLRAECEAYGEIAECKVIEGGHAFVHFQEVRQAVLARHCFLKLLTKGDVNDCLEEISYFNNQFKVGALNDIGWDISFFPLDLWSTVE